MNDSTPMLAVRNLRKYFPVQENQLWQANKRVVHAVDEVSFELGRAEFLAVVGESGCGKSTLAQTLMRLEAPTAGQIWFDGQEVTQATGPALKTLRRQMQMIFQDPYESLNPLLTVEDIVAEPLIVHALAGNRRERLERVTRALEEAGLRPATSYLRRRPHELSGGQRQRVVIASALVLEPKVLLADEPVSMLDVSIRAEILNLLADLRAQRGISILFITHDFGSVAAFADNPWARIAVMYLGRIVEIGPAATVLRAPSHPYTKALLSVVPVANPRQRHPRVILQGETPNPIDLPTGCRFHPRCPLAIAACKTVDPPYVAVTSEHLAACLLSTPADINTNK